jgi:hypothetical protein
MEKTMKRLKLLLIIALVVYSEVAHSSDDTQVEVDNIKVENTILKDTQIPGHNNDEQKEPNDAPTVSDNNIFEDQQVLQNDNNLQSNVPDGQSNTQNSPPSTPGSLIYNNFTDSHSQSPSATSSGGSVSPSAVSSDGSVSPSAAFDSLLSGSRPQSLSPSASSNSSIGRGHTLPAATKPSSPPPSFNSSFVQSTFTNTHSSAGSSFVQSTFTSTHSPAGSSFSTSTFTSTPPPANSSFSTSMFNGTSSTISSSFQRMSISATSSNQSHNSSRLPPPPDGSNSVLSTVSAPAEASFGFTPSTLFK